MYRNFTYANATEALPHLLEALRIHGDELGSRAGRVREMTHVGITLMDPKDRELLVHGRKPNLAAQIAETMWVLAGRSDVEFLSHYLPRAADFSDDGVVWRGGYGPRLRAWYDGHASVKGRFVDQLRENYELLKRDPATRRAVMSIFDPALDFADSKDIPCNNWLSWSSRLGKLDLHVAIRSNDAMWGWSGINAFEWSALQEVMAGLLGVGVGGLHFSTTSFHLYDRHWAKALEISKTAELTVPVVATSSPRFKVDRSHNYPDDLAWFEQQVEDWFAVEDLIRRGDIARAEDAVEQFSEPMLQSWLRVLQWWWSGELEYLQPLEGTRLEAAARMAVQPPEREFVELHAADREDPITVRRIDNASTSPFLQELCLLHLEKEAAYGGSWKKRGEMLGIMANIARKVDRIGGGETADETSADTAGDLLVYLAKYHTWLEAHATGTPPDYDPSDFASTANDLMIKVERELDYDPELFNAAGLAATITSDFDTLEHEVMEKRADRHELVWSMMQDAYLLARFLWEAERAEQPVLTDEYQGADHD